VRGEEIVIKDVLGVVTRTVAHGIVIKTADLLVVLTERMIVNVQHGVETATVVIGARGLVMVLLVMALLVMALLVMALLVMALLPEVSTGGSCCPSPLC
jgi:hypothetical protein